LVEGGTRMKNLKQILRVLNNRSGATAIEYALIAGLICLAIVAAVTTLGDSTAGAFVAANRGFEL
jgi:pilus assembly protein Flp/PilA